MQRRFLERAQQIVVPFGFVLPQTFKPRRGSLDRSAIGIIREWLPGTFVVVDHVHGAGLELSRHIVRHLHHLPPCPATEPFGHSGH